MKTPQMTELSRKRKNHAGHFLEGLKTEFRNFASKIKLATLKFTSTAKGFEFLVPEIHVESIKKYLDERDQVYTYQGNGNFEVEYTGNLVSPENQPKTLIRLCEKERKDIIRILGNKKFFPKRGGKSKKDMGVFTVNQSASIAQSMIFRIHITNKKLDTLNPIFKTVEGYYLKHEKKSSVSVKTNPENFTIEVLYQPEFFAIPTENPAPPPPPPTDPVDVNEKTKIGELHILLNAAFETDENLLGEIRGLRAKRELNQKALLDSVYSIHDSAFWEVFAEEALRVYRRTTDEHGLETDTQVAFDEELKNRISARVWEKLQMNK